MVFEKIGVLLRWCLTREILRCAQNDEEGIDLIAATLTPPNSHIFVGLLA